MSQQKQTKHLGAKYEAVHTSPLVDPSKVGRVRPSGMSKLKERYHELPERLEKGYNEKVGLTDKGYAVYRNTANGRIGYFYMIVTPETTETGRYWYKGKQTIEPYEKFGNHWIISP